MSIYSGRFNLVDFGLIPFFVGIHGIPYIPWPFEEKKKPTDIEEAGYCQHRRFGFIVGSETFLQETDIANPFMIKCALPNLASCLFTTSRGLRPYMI